MYIMQQITIIGNICNVPELKKTNSDKEFTNISIAVNEKFTDKNWNKQEETEFFSCTAWGNLASVIVNYAKKWDKIFVQGKIKTRTWDKDDGTKWYKQEVIIQNLELLGKKVADPENNNAKQAKPNQDINVENLPF